MPQTLGKDLVFLVSGHGAVTGTYTPLPQNCHLYIPAPLMHSLVISNMDMKMLTSSTEELLRWLRSGKLPIQSCKVASSQFQMARTGTPGCLYNDTQVYFDPFFSGFPNTAMKTGVYQLPMKELVASGVDTRGIQQLQQDLKRREQQIKKGITTTTTTHRKVSKTPQSTRLSKNQKLPRYTLQQRRLHNYFFYHPRYQRYTIEGEISTMSEESQKIMAAGRAKWALHDQNTEAYSRAVRLSMMYSLSLPLSIYDVRRHPGKTVLLSTLMEYLNQKFPKSNIHVIVLTCQTLLPSWKDVSAQMKMFYQCVSLSSNNKKRKRDQTLSDYRQGFETLLVRLYEILYKIEKEQNEWRIVRNIKTWYTGRPPISQRVNREQIRDVEKGLIDIFQILREGEDKSKTCRLEYRFFTKACGVIDKYKNLVDRLELDQSQYGIDPVIGFYHHFCTKKRELLSQSRLSTYL